MISIFKGESDRSRKHGMEEYINADPITYEHHKLFEYLQRQCLDWRLNDPYASLVSWKWTYRLDINYNIHSKSYFVIYNYHLFKMK